MKRLGSLTGLFIVALLATGMQPAFADETPSVALAIKDHAFVPATLVIPANQQVKIIISNQDALPAEFESYDFNREKVIPGNSKVSLYVGPLKAGSYSFFNDFYASNKGKLVVKEAEK